MSLLLSKYSIGIIMAIAGLFISKNLLCYKQKLNKIEVVLSVLLVASPTIIFYDVKFNAMVPFFTFVLSILAYRNLYKEKTINAMLLSAFVMILTSLADLGWSSIAKFFVDVTVARKTWYIMLISNIGISIISILFSKVKYIQRLFQALAKKLAKKVYFSTILFIILFILGIVMIHENMIEIFKTSEAYSLALTILIIFSVLYYIYMVEKINYDKLSDEYDSLFHCIQTFENWIDKEELAIHEMKNNLSIIRGMTNNKKIHGRIDDILQKSIVIEKEWIEQLKNIPVGGIKGLLYYKMAIAKDKNIDFYVEVSPKVSKILKNLSEETNRQLNILLGIYLDNAIESSEDTKKHLVMLEIYVCNNKLTFTLSNSYKDKPDLTAINRKGFSTKGVKRGKGLYFANKILNMNKNFVGTQKIMNEFYVQKLTIW